MPEITGVTIYAGLPGVGALITDLSTRASPQAVTTAISLTGATVRTRKFIKGSPGAITNPTLPNGSVNLKELYLFACDDTATVTMNNASNLELESAWVGGNGSMLYLMWDGASKWVEVSRNAI